MELKEIINKRQSIRKYKEGAIPDRDIKEIIEAAGKAPSGKNIQNWHFAVIKGQDMKDDIAAIITEKNESIALEMEKNDKLKADRFRKFCKNFTVFFTKAAVLTVVYSTFYKPSGFLEYESIGIDPTGELVTKRNPGMQSLGAALENFTLKAIDMGYGSCWLTSANYASNEIEEYIKNKTGFEKEGFFMSALMSLGIPEENQKSPSKKDIDEICTFLK
ncbi:MAG TPA: nitroreductase family protein [Bacillota bacterium]|nr:nitroreductase family protein [Bacillota bacterium]